MVELVSKIRNTKVYNLKCAIPLVGAKTEKVKVEGKEGEKPREFERVPTERVLTLRGGESRQVPEAVLLSPEIKSAIAKKWIFVKKKYKKPAQKAEPKTKPSEEAKPSAASSKSGRKGQK